MEPTSVTRGIIRIGCPAIGDPLCKVVYFAGSYLRARWRCDAILFEQVALHSRAHGLVLHGAGRRDRRVGRGQPDRRLQGDRAGLRGAKSRYRRPVQSLARPMPWSSSSRRVRRSMSWPRRIRIPWTRPRPRSSSSRPRAPISLATRWWRSCPRTVRACPRDCPIWNGTRLRASRSVTPRAYRPAAMPGTLLSGPGVGPRSRPRPFIRRTSARPSTMSPAPVDVAFVYATDAAIRKGQVRVAFPWPPRSPSPTRSPSSQGRALSTAFLGLRAVAIRPDHPGPV